MQIPANITPTGEVQIVIADNPGNLTLPDTSTLLYGVTIKVRRLDNYPFDVYIVPFGTQLIDNSINPVSLQPKETLEFLNSSGNWTIISNKLAVVNTYNDGNIGSTPFNITNTYDAYVAKVPTATTLHWFLPLLSTVPLGREFSFRNSGTGVLELNAAIGNNIEGNPTYQVSGLNLNITLVAYNNVTWIRTA